MFNLITTALSLYAHPSRHSFSLDIRASTIVMNGANPALYEGDQYLYEWDREGGIIGAFRHMSKKSNWETEDGNQIFKGQVRPQLRSLNESIFMNSTNYI